ncbi:hypothetical protein KQJ29_14735, partial [Enterococcus sp. S181_ASV_20]|nr:hypothetical protein [Enterococcus sp. S181_ASV_20]
DVYKRQHIIPLLSFLAFLVAGEVIAINLIVQVLYFKRTASYDLLSTCRISYRSFSKPSQ